jgi:hypothetical protein
MSRLLWKKGRNKIIILHVFTQSAGDMWNMSETLPRFNFNVNDTNQSSSLLRIFARFVDQREEYQGHSAIDV